MQTIKTTVWIAISSQAQMGLLFFDQIVNNESYVSMICNSFMLWLNATDLLLNTRLFMQDGATPHTANTVLDSLHDTFSPSMISNLHHACNGCGHKCPPKSPDINPCDLFLWGYLAEKLFPKGPASIMQLMALNVQMYGEIT
jgi:hypothetical protein